MKFFQNNSKKAAIRELPWTEPAAMFDANNNDDYFFFLDSSSDSNSLNKPRWSYLSRGKPVAVFKTSQGLTGIAENGRTILKSDKNPFSLIDTFCRKYRYDVSSKTVPFFGGAVGYISYECARYFENVPKRKKHKSAIPEIYFFIPSQIIAFNHNLKKRYLITLGDEPKSIVSKSKKNSTLSNSFEFSGCQSNFDLNSFSEAVLKTKEYIAAGDIFQANIAQRWQGDFSGNSKEVYKNLRAINPSPYSCYFRFPEFELLSCSPELLIKKTKNILETRPIAGTRRRGLTAEEDSKFHNELKLDEKERAEHIMLVDLERNDLGRIAEFKSVKLADKMSIEKYSHVSHIVSTVKCVLKKGAKLSEILRAVFPGGTITGCPKIRAMEIIDEIEPVERGPYCGSAGWISFDDDFELNILIRSIIVKGGKAYFYAGAGIVADSIPEREYNETRHKAMALAASLRCSI